MAYTTVNKSSDHFNTKLYTGTGSSNAQTGVGFQPDWVWIKGRSNAPDHFLFDVTRGVTNSIRSNVSSATYTDAQLLTAFGADGFTVGTNTNVNASSQTFVAWNWKAGTSSGVSGGDITPSAYSINTTSKLGIYKYTGNGSSSQTIAHGLGATPSLVMFKQTSGSEQWRVHYMKAPNPYTKMLILNSNAVEGDQSNGLSAVSSTTITIGNDGAYNSNGGTYLCYIFCDVTGYCQSASYVGNGNANGPFIYTGFKPAFVLIKKATGSVKSWNIMDNKRLGYNVDNNVLNPDNSDAEHTNDYIDILSNGFKIRSTNQDVNNDNSTYVYTAIGQSLVGSNNTPATTR